MTDFKCHKCGCTQYFNTSGGFTIKGVFLSYDARGRYRACAKCGELEQDIPPKGLDPDYIEKLHKKLDTTD